jgi:uncharacterized protein (DUF433 family)
VEHLTLERISIDPAVMSGQPCVRETRITVKRVLYVFAECRKREEIYKDFPGLEDEDIRQALLFAAESVDSR